MKKVFFILFAVISFGLMVNAQNAELYYVKSPPKQNEISIFPALRQFVNNNKQISVVLRTPRTTANVTHTQEVQNSELYNTIEGKLVNAGFVVRDGALLEKLLVEDQLSYESIGQKVKVDLIIEVLENSSNNIIPTKMFLKKNDKEIFISTRDKLNIVTSKFTFRIILVETGSVCGFFTFHYVPCTNGCDIYAVKYMGLYFFDETKEEVKRRIWGVDINTPLNHTWQVENKYISNDLSNKIISVLQGKYE